MPTPPYATTPHYGLGKWLDGDSPGAAALNFNWETIDTKIYEANSALTFSFPLKNTANVISLDYESNLKLTGNKLDTIQDIKTTSTPQFARMGIGGVADATIPLKVYGAAKITGDLTVDGNFYIGGNINQVNVVDLDVADHAIRLNKGGDNTTALQGGIEMLGTADAVIGSIKHNGSAWLSDLNLDIASGKVYKINNVEVLNATTLGASVVSSSLTSIGTLNHDLNIANTKVYKINGTQVLSSTALGSTVVGSSLTSVGTLAQGVWNATAINGQYINYNTTNLKVTSNQLNTIQDIAITSSPQFVNQTLTGTLDQQGIGSSYFGSQNVLPKEKYYSNLGSLQYKWLTLHAAELWVETLVAQETIATIGGRVLVGPTTSLVQDLASGVTTIHVKHNQMIQNDIVYMEASGKIEFMKITSGYSGSAGNYTYTVQRNLDGTGSNDWYTGDAMFNTGQAGNGFIDLYSIRGVKTASQTGPTIVGNVRNSLTYNDWSEHWAIGNLNNLYGYNTNIYGVGLGKYANSSSFITVDSTNGVRLRYKNAGGTVTDKITLDMSGNVSIAGYLQVGDAASDVNGGETNITGNRIRSGAIQSNNWTTTTGSYYDLVDGTITLGGSVAPKFSVDTTGKMISTSAEIAEWIVSAYDIRKTIGTSPNTKFISVAARSSALSGTGGNYPVVALADNVNPMYVSIGHAYYKSSFQNEFGFTFAHDPFNASANPIFQVTKNLTTGVLTTRLAGMSFDGTKIYVGSATAGMALNTSSTPFITGNNSKGFEVYDASNPKMFLGLRDGSGNISAGYDWNITSANKLTMKGEIISSRFSTGAVYDWNHNGQIAYIDVGIVGVSQPLDSTNSLHAKMNGTTIALRHFNSSLWTDRIALTASATVGSSKIEIDGKNVGKYHGILSSSPSNPRGGDTYIEAGTGVLYFYAGDGWIWYAPH